MKEGGASKSENSSFHGQGHVEEKHSLIEWVQRSHCSTCQNSGFGTQVLQETKNAETGRAPGWPCRDAFGVVYLEQMFTSGLNFTDTTLPRHSGHLRTRPNNEETTTYDRKEMYALDKNLPQWHKYVSVYLLNCHSLRRTKDSPYFLFIGNLLRVQSARLVTQVSHSSYVRPPAAPSVKTAHFAARSP